MNYNIKFTQPRKRKRAKIMCQSEAKTQIGNEVDSYGVQLQFIFRVSIHLQESSLK